MQSQTLERRKHNSINMARSTLEQQQNVDTSPLKVSRLSMMKSQNQQRPFGQQQLQETRIYQPRQLQSSLSIIRTRYSESTLNNKIQYKNQSQKDIQPLINNFNINQPYIKIQNEQQLYYKIKHCIEGKYFNTVLRYQKYHQNIKTKNFQIKTSIKHAQQRNQIELNYQFSNQNHGQYYFKYSVRSRPGQQSPKRYKINQDNYLIYPHIGRKPDQHLFLVCDGHGINGHFVSQFIKQNFPSLINSHRDQLQKEPQETLDKIFQFLNTKLINKEQIDTNYSGSTLILYCSNLGDSRAILGRQQAENQWDVITLSRNHKPTEQDECDRINACGGRIGQSIDSNGQSYGPLRVYEINTQSPGLAMTRSIGDQFASKLGVSQVPEIRVHRMLENDRIIVIGSDGLFEFLSDFDILKIIQKYYANCDIEGASDELMEQAIISWQQRVSMIDDITFILFFLTDNIKEII